MKFNLDNYKGKYAMHTKTYEEAKDFCQYLHANGRQWSDGESYAVSTEYWCNGDQMVFLFNIGRFWNVDDAKEDGYTILEWADFMNGTFTKADLKTGDVVLRRDGAVEIVNRELGMLITRSGWNDLTPISNDLCFLSDEQGDIMAVRRPTMKHHCQFDAFKREFGTLVYEREEPEEMTLAEVCKLLGKNIKIIQ